MILYHGTNIDFKAIELSKCVPYKDFGKGFYLTDIRNQAEALAQKKSILFGGSPVVQEYVFIPEDAEKAGLKMLSFDTPSREWAEFIFIGRYEEGSINLDELAKELEFRDLNNQYYFGTRQATELLKRL